MWPVVMFEHFFESTRWSTGHQHDGLVALASLICSIILKYEKMRTKMKIKWAAICLK
jgi:hypothetical protein